MATNVELKYSESQVVRAASGTVGKAYIAMQALDKGHESTTILYQGPLDTSKLHSTMYMQSDSPVNSDLMNDLMTFTIQLPKTKGDVPVSDGCGIILVDIQGSSVCLDPVIYTWLLYQPRQVLRSKVISERASSVESSKKKPSSKESTSQPKEVQAAPLKMPAKPKDSEKMEKKVPEKDEKEKPEGKDDFLMDLWSTLKRLTVQIDLQSCFITLPMQHITFDPSSQNIPQCLRHCILGNDEIGVSGLVVTTPTISVQSVGHRKMSPLQEIPLHWKDLPPDTGEKLPWNLRASNFSVYTAHSPHILYYLLHPMGMAATLGVTASAATPSAVRPSLGLCIHADMQAVTTCVSHPQMLLMFNLIKQVSSVGRKIPSAFSFTPPSSAHVPTSPSKSLRVLSSVTSSGQPEPIETTSISSPIESVASPRPSEEETPEIQTGLKLSLWLQWTLQKFVVKLYGQEKEHIDTKMKCTVEDLTTSIDVQDVYSKISCKVGALNVMHYAKRESSWHRGAFKGVVFSCDDTITHDTQILGVNIANKPTPRSFNPFAASNTKPTDIKKAHSFLTFTWTRALCKSVSQKMFGRKVENLTKLSPEEQASARQQFVNEVIIASRPFDLVLWYPVLSSITGLFALDTSSPDPRTQSEPLPFRSWRKRSPSSASLKSASESQATRISSHKKVPSNNTNWMTNQNLPLIYMDCKDFRVFVPAKEPSTSDADLSSKEDGEDTVSLEGDTFVLQVNSVVLSPHADNPLQRLVVKKDVYRKAVQSGITDRPGSEIEDRQYQLDIDGMTVSVGSWKQIETITDQSKVKPPATSTTMTQNPALEWNTSLPRQNPGVVGLTPIVFGFDLRVVAAPAIVTGKAIICGHSLEVNATSDITFYISTQHVCLMQTMLEHNLQALTNPAPKQPIWSPTEGAHSNAQQSYSAVQYRKPLQLEDSGIGSEESLRMDISNQLHQITVDVGAPPKSLHHSPRPVVIKPKFVKRTSVMPSHNRPAKPKSKHLTPSDILFTAGKINVFLYSRDLGDVTSPPLGESGAVQLLNASSVATETSIVSEGKIHPFLHLEVSQPSAIASIERHQQKVEFSIYDISLDGASVKNSAVESTEPLPSAPDYTVPWFETCPGEPDSKTGVRPSLVTLTVGNILSKKASLRLNVARPVKVNLSLTKVNHCMEFVKKMSLPKKVEIDTRPKAKYHADGEIAFVSSHRPVVASSVPLIIPAMGQVPQSTKTSDTTSAEDAMNLLLNITDVTIDMVQFVVVLATYPDPQYPHVVLSLGSCRGKADITNDIDGKPSELASTLNIKDLQVKTSLEHKTRPLLGPVTMETSLDARWDAQYGGRGNTPRMTVNMHLGHVPVCFGQEHLTCFTMMQERVMQYLGMPEQTKPKPKTASVPSKQLNKRLAEESSNDDLRAGAFKYITDSEGGEFQPKPNEIIFSCPPPPDLSVSGIEDYNGGWGSMSWCYPQPRVLTRVSVTPIPLHLADRPDETQGKDHIEEIPCTLEYWDDMRKCYNIYKQLYVSEVESYLFTIDMPLGENHLKIGEATAAQIWRVVLNSVAEEIEDIPLSQTCRKNLIITPTALAASMRIDSYFAPHLIPTAKLAFNMECLEIRLTHHLSQLGQAQPHQMKPFKFDGVAPNEQEYMVITVNNTELYGQHWSGVKQKSAMQLGTSVQCDLLTYRNLNMTPFLEEAGIEATFEAHWGQDVNFLLDLGSVELRVGQGSIHSLNMALQAWNQYGKAEEEQVLFTYFTICNDTSEALRFGQVHTDEALVLGSRQMHAYSWRTHKHHEQFLHVCIEGWRNWRWSEPFNIDKPGTVVRTLEYKEQKATLFIKIKQISPLQKQVIFYGQQIFSSRLTETLEVQLLHLSHVGSQLVDSRQVYKLSSRDVLPSLTCSDEGISGVRVKVADQEADWSEQFAISGEMSRGQVIVTIPCKDGPPLRLWCGIQTEDIHGYTQRLIVFSPLFIVRSHLPRPLVINLQSQKLHDLQLVEAAGRGSDQPLHHVPPDVWYNMTFQLSQAASPSSPSIPISTELIHQVTPQPDEGITMESLCDGWAQDLNAVWPYNQPEYDSSISYPCSLRHTGLPEVESDQPNTDLQVSLCQYWAKLNTVLIDVMPWCLVVNETDRDMLILEDGERSVRCGKGQTVSPQRFKGPFHICAITEEHTETNWSSPIHLLTEPTSPRADGLVTGTLTLSGEGFVNIHLPNQHDNKTVHVTLTSTVQHNVRVMTIRPRFVLVNNTKKDLKLKAVHVAVGDEKPNVQQSTLYSQFIPSNPSSRNPLPVYEWNVLPVNQQDKSPVGFQHCVQLFSLAVCQRYTPKQQSMLGTDIWSSWIPVDEGRPRQPATLLDSEALFRRDSEDERTVSLPVVAILQEHKGIMYISLEIDPAPLVTVHNTCLFPLHIGQAMTNYKDAVKTQVVEEISILSSIPVIPANSVYHYDLQQHVNSNKELPTIHLSLAQHPGAVVYKTTDSPRYQWSEGIILAMGAETRSEIVALTGGGYVLVTSFNVGRQTRVAIDPLTMSMERGYPVGEQNQLMAGASQADQQMTAMQTPTKTQPTSSSAAVNQECNISVEISKLVIKIMDEVTDLVMMSEIMRATLDDIRVMSYPVEDTGRKKVKTQMISVVTGPFQIDNQLFHDGKFDFGVLFKSRHKHEDESYITSPEHSYEGCRFTLCLESNDDIGTNIANIQINLKNSEVFIEDQFLYEMMTRIRSYVPASQRAAQKAISSQKIPSQVTTKICSLQTPVGMRNLEIGPVAVLASVHASLKVFIAVDRTLLSFGQLETGPVFASSSQLIEALTMHFTSGALFKAGWALGSLEILGNPAGFLRSVKIGLTDTVMLPYEGLTRGPAAFVSGVTNGVTSLVRHVSAGTLTSVTKFASSVARNLDRLSLDADHIARQEAHRRRAPDRVTEGLMQGLSGFGISVLGAIAGIADQPLQSIQEASGTSTPTTTKAKGIITGVGKGLVGVVIKPLGGAAEFLAQTGEGILHGAGLADAVRPRSAQFTELSAMASNSRLKYTWKMLHSLPNADIIMHVDVTSVTFHGLHRSGCLLLTPEILFVVSASEDTQQQAFPVSDVECIPRKSCNPDVTNSSLLCIVPKRPMSPSSQEKEDTTDRVAEFVDKTSGYATNYDQLNVSSDSQSEASSPSMIDSTPTYQYFMSRQHRETFLTLFAQAKNRLSGKGFCYDETYNTNFSRFKTWHLTTKAQLDD
ncbi:intermembrane lipid transfer protein VPS13B-like isoform X1 [Amphiura filiformis]